MSASATVRRPWRRKVLEIPASSTWAAATPAEGNRSGVAAAASPGGRVALARSWEACRPGRQFEQAPLSALRTNDESTWAASTASEGTELMRPWPNRNWAVWA